MNTSMPGMNAAAITHYHRAAIAARIALLLSVGAICSAQANGSELETTDIIEMDPFDVRSVETNRYMAANSISGTAMNMALKHVPMNINVITSEFIEDLNETDFTRALDFNTSVSQPHRSEINNRFGVLAIRGFRNRNVLLDGVLAGEFLPTDLIDRIEVVKGPNTLYGQSDPGGLINVISKRPGAKRFAKINITYDT